MAINIEIKAVATHWAAQRAAARRLAATAPVLLTQTDTFFPVPVGRLKLREFGRGGGAAELIAYDRPDISAPKSSRYLITRTSDAVGLKACLAAALGIRATVLKKRWLYLVGATRIHFDEVKGLGRFIELEVVLAPAQSRAAGRRVARDLMARLMIQPADLVGEAYVDLLEHRRGER